MSNTLKPYRSTWLPAHLAYATLHDLRSISQRAGSYIYEYDGWIWELEAFGIIKPVNPLLLSQLSSVHSLRATSIVDYIPEGLTRYPVFQTALPSYTRPTTPFRANPSKPLPTMPLGFPNFRHDPSRPQWTPSSPSSRSTCSNSGKAQAEAPPPRYQDSPRLSKEEPAPPRYEPYSDYPPSSSSKAEKEGGK